MSGGMNIVENVDGNLEDYQTRFTEDRVLGEGEFGVVTLVHDKSADNKDLAMKTLRKGVVFKDNTLYPACPPEILLGEVNMLRALNGKHYCMELVGVYETPRAILMVTELCSGGEMMEYVSKQTEDLRTEDVSRISFQLLDAVNHCAKCNIIHRDIKPENTMFTDSKPGSTLKLIDFGSGTIKVVEGVHTTFAGTPFYNSPEIFQKKYTQMTDVWSVGVTLYVLVAGYPSECLQKAFNLLLNTKRDLKTLPNLPDDMPDTYYEMLEGLLMHSYKKRTSAGDVLKQEFVQFHRDLLEESNKVATDTVATPSPKRTTRLRRTSSVTLLGSVGRHSMFLEFKKFERSLTTILATMLPRDDLSMLLKLLEGREKDGGKEQILKAIPVSELITILEEEVNQPKV
jgi:serine/threonine protein kinase